MERSIQRSGTGNVARRKERRKKERKRREEEKKVATHLSRAKRNIEYESWIDSARLVTAVSARKRGRRSRHEGWRTPKGPSVARGDLPPPGYHPTFPSAAFARSRLFLATPVRARGPLHGVLVIPAATTPGARSLVHRVHAGTRRHTQLPPAVVAPLALRDRLAAASSEEKRCARG